MVFERWEREEQRKNEIVFEGRKKEKKKKKKSSCKCKRKLQNDTI